LPFNNFHWSLFQLKSSNDPTPQKNAASAPHELAIRADDVVGHDFPTSAVLTIPSDILNDE